MKTKLLMVTILLATVSALASGQRVTVQVKGMSCPFCAFNLEKRIKTIDGVAEQINWQTSIKESTISFDWIANRPINEKAIRDEVKKAGFVSGKIEVKDKVDAAPKKQPSKAKRTGRGS